MSESILILGANGMLGSSLLRYFSRDSRYEVIGSVRSEGAYNALLKQGFDNIKVGVDVNNIDDIENLMIDVKPTFVFNCVGIIKQYDISKIPVPSIRINSLLPHQLAELCDKLGGKLIHFSSDCIFSGDRGMYHEDDIPTATDLYGRSKLLGEVNYGKHLTLRTSIIGHEIDSSVSLVDWFLSQKVSVKGFSKAIFSGLPTVCVAEFLENHVLNNEKLSGLYHLSVNPIDKYTLLNLIKEQYKFNIEIEKFEEFEIDRSLDSSKLRATCDFSPLSWSELIKKMHDEYKEYFTS